MEINMKIIGYLGQQRYPKDKSIYDKNGNINENYIFAFDPTNALGNKKNISSIKIHSPNMALVVNNKVCIDYDNKETKAILISREDALGDIIRFANPNITHV